MSHLSKVTDYLDAKDIEYEVLHHEVAYTAPEIAANQHVPGRKLVKSVLVEGPEGFLLCVMPAIHNIDFDKLCSVVGVEDLKLASEEQVGELFPECELGAEPPFGYWAGLPVYLDKSLAEETHIVFNAGTHTDTVRISLDDYRRLENPMLADIGVHIPVG